MIIFIENTVNFHYEIVINVIEKYNLIIQNEKSIQDEIYLSCYFDKNFILYIKNVYPNIKFKIPHRYDYYINCTVYPNKFRFINDGRHYYISHEVFSTDNKYIFFLTPLNNNNNLVCDILPFQNNVVDFSIPIYVIQGNLTDARRNYNLLERLLTKTYDYDFRIKIIGRGKLDKKFNKYADKLLLRYNLDFENYHREFLNCYTIIPLISKKSHPQYYKNKLTSSINYGLSYNLNFLIDNDLQDIYKLKNSYVYTNDNDIVDSFKRSLEDFYNNRRLKC